MQHSELSTIINSMPTHFAFNVASADIPTNHILMNAPRPLFGKPSDLDARCHGRFFSLIDLDDRFSAGFAAKNSDLDACVVMPVTKDELIDLVLRGHKYEAQYRELETSDLFFDVGHLVKRIQRIPFSTATEMLAQVRKSSAE